MDRSGGRNVLGNRMYVPGERNVLGAFGSAPVLCSPCCGSVLGAVGKEAGSGKVELIWEGGSRIGGGEMFWELGVEMFCVLPSGVSIFAGSGSCDCSGFSSVSLDFDERSQALCSFISRS